MQQRHSMSRLLSQRSRDSVHKRSVDREELSLAIEYLVVCSEADFAEPGPASLDVVNFDRETGVDIIGSKSRMPRKSSRGSRNTGSASARETVYVSAVED